MTLQLTFLHLQNYRCFERIKITFEPDLTVLVAPNGGGKSTLLSACALGLSLAGESLGGLPAPVGIHPDDVRTHLSGSEMIRAPFAHVQQSWFHEGNSLSCVSSTLKKGGSDPTSTLARAMSELRATRSGQTKDATKAPLPVLAHFGSRRGFGFRGGNGLGGGQVRFEDPFSVYASGLGGDGNFPNWFDRLKREAQDVRDTGFTSQFEPEAQLEAVSSILDAFLEPLTGWRGITWSFLSNELVGAHPVQGRLPIRLLSDGQKLVIGLAIELAHQCVRLNRHLGKAAAAETPGIVLIDEVDLHLHPEWQQTILGSLRAAFPRIQFIVTTHSPQVLSTVDKRCIRVLHADGSVTTPQQQTKGVESPTILATVMGVDPIPPVEEAVWVRDYQALIETERGDTPEALELRAKIINHFGEWHQVVLDCDRMIRWQNFKLRRAAEKREG